MIDELLLISGNDIPFIEAEISVHQPTLKEIAYITEKRFWTGYQVLKFSKDSLLNKELLEDQQLSNFKLIMLMLLKNSSETKDTKISVLSILALLFPEYRIILELDQIKLIHNQKDEIKYINDQNFNSFKEILSQIFCFGGDGKNKQYDPSGSLAKKIADQIRKGKQKRAQLGPKQEKISFFSRYISILATAKNKSIKEIMDYTIYQLMDEFNRFMLYRSNEQWFSMKIAGASGLKEPEDWLKDIHI